MTNIEIHSHLTRNLETLINNGKIGFSHITASDIQTVPNSYIEMTMGLKNYHFCVHVPYGGNKLNWEIIFDPKNWLELPDFSFNDQSFLAEPNINYIAQNIQSWDNWNLADEHAMLKILNEFLILYKKFQLEKLSKQNMYANFRREYEDLIKLNTVLEEHVEVYIENKNMIDVIDADCGLLNFLIYLSLDFSDLPEYYQEECEISDLLNPGDDFALLHFQIRKLDNSQTKVSLQLCPRAEQLLGKFKLPKHKKEMSLCEYVQLLQHCIEEQVQLIIERHHKKNLFISTIVNMFSSSIVEYNNRLLNKIVFIYEDYEDYDCLVTITLGLKFPQDRPKIQLSSLYCQVNNSCNKILTFEYDQLDDINDMVKDIIQALKDNVKIFQNHRH